MVVHTDTRVGMHISFLVITFVVRLWARQEILFTESVNGRISFIVPEKN